MSTFTDMYSAIGVPTLFNAMAETVTYTPDGGDAKSILAVVNRYDESILFDDDGKGERQNAGVLIKTDATNGVVSPSEGDAVAFDSKTFFVNQVGGTPDGGLHKLTVTRYVSSQRSMPDLWRQR